jgi:hypothetical protein
MLRNPVDSPHNTSESRNSGAVEKPLRLEDDSLMKPMKSITGRIFQFSMIAGAIALLALTPRAAHAVTAALVQVSNTLGAPANTLDSSKAAAQQVLLQTPFEATLAPGQQINMIQLSPTLGVPSETGYTVPSGYSLVVTGVDLVLYGHQTGPAFLRINVPGQGLFAYETFNQMPAGFYPIKFSSGVVYPAGSQVVFDNSQGTSAMEVVAHGYLTAE